MQIPIASGLVFVFDLDGVLIDSMPMHAEAWRAYLERHGKSVHDLETRMHGARNDQIVEAFFGGHLPPGEAFSHGAAKERLFREMMGPRIESHIVGGLREFLAATENVPKAIASNAERANIDLVLDDAKLRSRFQFMVDGHQVANAKPAPDVYLRAAELLDSAPGNCIVFEDSPTGVEAARRAGTRIVGVATYRETLDDVNLMIRDFADPRLAAWLLKQAPA